MENLHKMKNSKNFMNIFYIGILCILSIAINGCGARNYLRNYTNVASPRYANLHAIKSKNITPDKLKVISYNIEYARKIPEAITILKKYSALKNADIIFLQEMDEEGVQHIAHALGYNYVYYPAVIHPINKKDFGNAVLSKWTILNDQKIIIPNFDLKSRQRIAVGATLQIGDKKVMVFSLHMGIFVKPSERKQRVSIILKHIPDSIKYSIIGGDFNTFTKKDNKEIFDAFTKFNFQYATKNIGWTNKHWFLFFKKPTLDHIYTKGLISTQSGKIIDRTASDHLPIWTELTFQKNQPQTLTVVKNRNL